jgi:hypothetical protein
MKQQVLVNWGQRLRNSGFRHVKIAFAAMQVILNSGNKEKLTDNLVSLSL